MGNPCIVGQGDCDRDAECDGTLVCGTNNCNSDFDAGVASGKDCCRENRVFDWNWCSIAPCGEGKGDCDKDDHCEGSLVCGTDNCQDFDSTQNSKKDCCISVTTTSSDCSAHPGGCAGNPNGGNWD